MTKTLDSTKPAAPSHHVTDAESNPNSTVVGLTISMAWQLALIVLVPVFGGHLLDNHLHPNGAAIYTLIGLAIAIAGMIIVVRNTLKELNKYMAKSFPDKTGDTK
jgi:F0F1-type ATP synthase assembly protein I